MRHVGPTDEDHVDLLLAAADPLRQAREQDIEIAQLDPPQRASRNFPYGGRLHSSQPDALGLLRSGDRDRPLSLEQGRRVIRPSTMAAELGPYLRSLLVQVARRGSRCAAAHPCRI